MTGNWFSDLHTAADIITARQVLMTWREQMEQTNGGADHVDWRAAAARHAARITARAVELSLETPDR